MSPRHNRLVDTKINFHPIISNRAVGAGTEIRRVSCGAGHLRDNILNTHALVKFNLVHPTMALLCTRSRFVACLTDEQPRIAQITHDRTHVGIHLNPVLGSDATVCDVNRHRFLQPFLMPREFGWNCIRDGK